MDRNNSEKHSGTPDLTQVATPSERDNNSGTGAWLSVHQQSGRLDGCRSRQRAMAMLAPCLTF